MNRQDNITRFELEMSSIERPGVDKLMNYISRSDFYTAPASTKYHLSCEGGLLQHSLNVLDALRGILTQTEDGWEYRAAGKTILKISDESVIIIALLHDICKTHFYTVSTRNAKNEQTGKWEKVPYYTVNDKMPLGHGAKSAMIIKQYMELTAPEMYAIWWHMGFTDTADTQSLTQAIKQYPIIWAVHTADMMASYFMEAGQNNKPLFISVASSDEGQATEYADVPMSEAEFQEAPAYAT